MCSFLFLQVVNGVEGSSKETDADSQTFAQPCFFTGGELRQYQIEGVRWLTVS